MDVLPACGFDGCVTIGPPPERECWALWEPLPLDADAAEVEAVTLDHPAFRRAAHMLGVLIASE